MKFIGTKSIPVAQEEIIDRCTKCGASNTVNLHLTRKCSYFLFIPTVPGEKVGWSECTACKQKIASYALPVLWGRQLEDLKRKHRAKIWMFSGLIVFPLVFLLAIVETVKYQYAQNMKLIENPMVGDLYEVRLAHESYVLFKVQEISNDTLYVAQSRYETTAPEGFSNIISKGFHEAEVFPYHKSEIKEMFKHNEILDVRRRKDMK
jgi:hypothetical protein